MSTGSDLRTSTAATSCPAAARAASARSSGASGPPVPVSTTTTCWVPAGPTPTTATPGPLPDAGRDRSRTVRPRLHPLLDADRRHRAVRGADHVHRAALHPQPTGLVQHPDIAGAVPARDGRPRPGRAPTRVVAILEMRCADPDLTADPGPVGQLGAGDPGRRRAARSAARHPAAAGRRRRRRRRRPPRSPAARCRSAAGLRSSRRGCACRRSAAPRSAAAAARPGPARRRSSAAAPGQRGPLRGRSARSAVASTLVSAAGEAKTTVASMAAAASASAAAVSVPGRVTSVAGTADGTPSAGPYKRERGEGGDDPVVGGDAVGCRGSARSCARTWRCRYSTPLAGPVAPEVKITAASSSGPASCGRRQVAARPRPAPAWCGATRAARRNARGDVAGWRSGCPAPASARRRAARRCRRSRGRSGPLRSARPIPRRPRPLSTTTITAAACQTAYSATVSSIDGGTSSATRSPGRTPAAARPAAVSRTRWCSSAQLMLRPPTSTTARQRRRPPGRRAAASSVGPSSRGMPSAAAASDVPVGQSADPVDHRGGVSGGVLGQQVAGAARTGAARPAAAGPAGPAGAPPGRPGRAGPTAAAPGPPSPAMPSAIPSSAGRLGWPAAKGMSATKSPTAAPAADACRRGRRTRPGRPRAAAARSATWWSGRTAASTGRRPG